MQLKNIDACLHSEWCWEKEVKSSAGVVFLSLCLVKH